MRITQTMSAVLIAASLTFGLAPAAIANPAPNPTTSIGAKAAWDAAGKQAEVLSERLDAANEALSAATGIEQADAAQLVDANTSLATATQLLQSARQTVAFADAALSFVNAQIVTDQQALNAIASSAYTGGRSSGLQNLMSAGTAQDYLDGQQMLASVAANNAQTMAKAQKDRAQQIATVSAVKAAESIAAAAQSEATSTLDAATASKTQADAAKATAAWAQKQATAGKSAMDGQVAKLHALFDKLSATEKAAALAAKAKAAADAKSMVAAFLAQQASATLAAGQAILPTLTPLQSAVARQVAGVAVARHLGERGVLIGLMTGLTESGLANLTYGDSATSSSLGVMQQLKGWGTAAQRLDAASAAGLFYDRLVNVPNWATIDPWVAAQTVQQSQFSDGSNYRVKLAQAQLITTAILASPTGQAASSPQAQLAVSFAMAQVGKPYVWGATGPNSFDCSGLTQTAWAKAGISIPRVSSEQATLPAVPLDQLQPGDLITYYSPVSHVAIYVGGGMVVSAADEALGIIFVPVAHGGPNPMGHRVLV